jgi:hypothetical protein
MRRLAIIAVYLAGGLVFNTSVRAEDVLSSNNPYATIVRRNVFGLKPPQPAQTPLEITPNDTIKPTGIMSIFGPLQVLFKVTGSVKAGQTLKEASYILSEGEQQDGIEVVHIDDAASLVTFNNHGVVQTIPLPNAPTTNSPRLTISGAATTSYKPKMVGAIGTGRTPPYFGGGDDNPGQGSQIPRTKEEQILMIESLRQYYKSQNDPRANSLPPTAMTPPDALQPSAE